MANMGPVVGLSSLALGLNSLALGLITLALGPTTILSMGQARDQVQDAFVLAAIHVKDQHQGMGNVCARNMTTIRINVCRSGVVRLIMESAGLQLALDSALEVARNEF